jgi:hypothetical protein
MSSDQNAICRSTAEENATENHLKPWSANKEPSDYQRLLDRVATLEAVLALADKALAVTIMRTPEGMALKEAAMDAVQNAFAGSKDGGSETAISGSGTLHIIAQGFSHDPAWVIGTKEALIGLQAAIGRTLDGGEVQACQTFSADGEGFHIMVASVTEKQMEAVPFGYTEGASFGLVTKPWTEWMGTAYLNVASKNTSG